MVDSGSQSMPVAESLAATCSAAKIMLVDDEPINIRVTCKQLKLAGYSNFVSTTEATQAMEMIRKERPDILLLDINMPEVSGLEILARLHDDEELVHIPTIVLTASDSERDADLKPSVAERPISWSSPLTPRSWSCGCETP